MSGAPSSDGERPLGYDPRGFFFFVVIDEVRHEISPPATVEERVRLATRVLTFPVARGGALVERLASQWVPGSEATLHDAMTAFAAGLVAGAEVKLELELEDGP